MSAKVVAALLLGALVWASSASASSITNREDEDYKVTIIEAASTQDHVLAPAAELKDVCKKGCIVRLNDDKDVSYQLTGADVVSIEDGLLYYDGQPDAPVPKSDEPERPFQPGDR